MQHNTKAADAVWIATALLQRAAPDAEFAVPEIVDRVAEEHLTEKPKQTIYLHANQHCVANRAPNNARLRMLFETPSGKRRLFHKGDLYHCKRANAPTVPDASQIPEKYRELLDWYQAWNHTHGAVQGRFDALLALVGTGKELWADEPADEYVRHLREGWE